MPIATLSMTNETESVCKSALLFTKTIYKGNTNYENSQQRLNRRRAKHRRMGTEQAEIWDETCKQRGKGKEIRVKNVKCIIRDLLHQLSHLLSVDSSIMDRHSILLRFRGWLNITKSSESFLGNTTDWEAPGDIEHIQENGQGN